MTGMRGIGNESAFGNASEANLESKKKTHYRPCIFYSM
jgi:hypothetical protein